MDDSDHMEEEAHERFMVKPLGDNDWNCSDNQETAEITTPLAVFSDDLVPHSSSGGHYVAFHSPRPQCHGQAQGVGLVCLHCQRFIQRCFSKCHCPTVVSEFQYRIFPHGCKEEIIEQLKLAWPVICTMSTQFVNLLVSLIFCGHLGTTQLASLALVMTIINVTGNSVMLGLSTACDTLFSQTYGSKNKFRVGVILQRSILILMLCCLPCWAILVNTEHLLVYLGQKSNIARLSGKYAMIYVAALPAVVIADVLSKYLQAQSIVIPSLIIGLISNIVNAGLHALFIFVLHFGIVGAAIAVTITQWLVVLLHLIYIVFSKVYITTWAGWSRDCLYEWWMFMSLALPGLFMVCLEWWCFEIIVFLVGFLGVIQLAGHIIVYNIQTLILMIPLGLSVAASVRIGNHLGAASPTRALTAARVSLCMAAFIAILASVLVMSARNYLPLLFTNDKKVVALVSKLLLLLALLELFDCSQGTASGVLRGIACQKFGAVVNFIAYYCINLPIGIPLLLKTSLGVPEHIYPQDHRMRAVWQMMVIWTTWALFWKCVSPVLPSAYWGMIVGCIIQTTAFLVKIFFVNWELESEKALLHAGVTERMSIQSVSRGQTLPPVCTREDNLSTDTTELVEADHLTLSDTSSHRSEDSESQTSPICTPGLLNIVLLRVAVAFSFLVILVGGVTLKVYLDGRPVIRPHCVVINSTDLDKTFIIDELRGNATLNLNKFDRNVLNMTYLFEKEHNWNQTFVYCSGVVKPFTAGMKWPTYNKTWLLNNLYPHIHTKPFG